MHCALCPFVIYFLCFTVGDALREGGKYTFSSRGYCLFLKNSAKRIQVSLKHYLPEPQLERQGMNSCIVCSCGSTTKHYLNFPSEEKDGSSTPENEHFLVHCDGEIFLFSSALEFMRPQLSPQAHPE